MREDASEVWAALFPERRHRATRCGHRAFPSVRRRISIWLQFMVDGARDWWIFYKYFFLGVLAVKL
jgi:hypothetical protein